MVPCKNCVVVLISLSCVLLAMEVRSVTSSPDQATLNRQSDPFVFRLEPYASGFIEPVSVVSAGGHSLFVVERRGLIKLVRPGGAVENQAFLDIRDRVDSSSPEEGLLGLVFHPDFLNNGLFFVNYTNTTAGLRRSRISRFKISQEPTVADPDSEEVLLTIDQPAPNHNAGHILFGPDRYLYIPLGDGGGGGDPGDNAQKPATLLGKIARIDVDTELGNAADCVGQGTGNYSIPDDNPFIDGKGMTCDEIWASGLRNPWRTSFDQQTGDLFIGDVGQDLWEEINYQPLSSAGGENYGWRCYEGSHLYNLNGCDQAGSYEFPIFEYNHGDNGCSVTGGYVYRGFGYPGLQGRYLMTDYCSGIIWTLQKNDAGQWLSTRHDYLRQQGNVAFGESCDGELFLVNKSSGTVFHVQIESTPKISPDHDTKRLQQEGELAESYTFLPLVTHRSCQLLP